MREKVDSSLANSFLMKRITFTLSASDSDP